MDVSTLPGRWKQMADRHPALVDATWATLFLVLTALTTQAAPSEGLGTPLTADAVGIMLLLAATLPYYFRRRSPLAVLLISATAVLLLSGINYNVGASPLIVMAGAYAVGSRCSARVAWWSYAFVAVGLIGLYATDPPGLDFGSMLANLAFFAAAFLFGWNVQSRGARLEALEQRAQAVSREHEEEARRALADERLRIAQELHDVVAHSMGVIAVQAGAGMHVIDTDPAEAKRSLEAISSTSRSTLTEIRRLLGVLREDDGHTASYAPAPGIDDLAALAGDLTDAGVVTTLRLDGARVEVPKGVELTTYRIVQEALTNVLKHGGPGVAATVVVTLAAGAVLIEVSDDGRGIDLAADPGVGHGLRGMRERVAVYAGEFQAGPRTSGGFRVTARLPYDTAAPAPAAARAPAPAAVTADPRT